MKKTILAAAAILIASTAPSFAQPYQGDQRQYNQDHRIDQGVRSGELTRGEANNLYRQQNRIDRYEHRAKYDGHLSYAERRKIDRMQDRASNRIHDKKHNDRDRW